jgi:uncharacterized protein (TIGR00290 family)
MLWSGGKDSALALHRARTAGLEVTRLHTFYEVSTGRVRFHGTAIGIIEEQVSAIDSTEFTSDGTSWSDMPARLEGELANLRSSGFAGVVLGDIHLADVRAWYEERVTFAGLEHIEPIWAEPPGALLAEFVESGGRAIVTCVDLSRLDRSWLGRVIDQNFVADIASAGVDPCGENGEYHSFAFDGPLFKRPLRWRAGEVREDERFAQVDVVLDV